MDYLCGKSTAFFVMMAINGKADINEQQLLLLGGEVAGVVFPLGDEGGHVGGEVAVEVHLLPGLGMDEAQGLGVQGLARA